MLSAQQTFLVNKVSFNPTLNPGALGCLHGKFPKIFLATREVRAVRDVKEKLLKAESESDKSMLSVCLSPFGLNKWRNTSHIG